MNALPGYVTLAPGETAQALIGSDRGVRLLSDGLLLTLGLIALTLVSIALDGRSTRGVAALFGSGLLTTFVFLLGPLVVQRLFGAPAAYVLTSRRLILAEDDAIELRDIRRLRVWMTSVSIQTESRRIALKHLVNPAAVAQLIRDTIAR